MKLPCRLWGDHRKPPRPPDPSMRIWTYIVLLCLLNVLGVYAQGSSTTSTGSESTASTTSTAAVTLPTIIISDLPILLTLPSINSTSPRLQLNLPQTSPLYITINICSLTLSPAILPSILLSTNGDFDLGSSSGNDLSTGGVGKVGNRKGRNAGNWKVVLNDGFGNWTGGLEGDDDLDVGLLFGLGMGDDGDVDEDLREGIEGNVVPQVGISQDGPIHYLSPASPLFGDTTSTSALLFSPLLLSSLHDQPSYPNCTLPPPILELSPYPNTPTNLTTLSSVLTLLIIPTAASPTNDGLDNSLCAVKASNSSTGNVAALTNQLVHGTQWMSVGGEEGYRSMWVVGDLIEDTNYTAWIVDDEGGMSSPIWFVTKPSAFNCPLVLPTALCPGIAYAAPLPANATQAPSGSSYPISTLPDSLTSILTSSYQSFSTSLLSQACGRDLYSHVSSCTDCFATYRDWACRIAIPQCTSTNSPATTTIIDEQTDGLKTGPPTPQTVMRDAGSTGVGEYTNEYEYTELLPCLGVCNAVDRACPVFLGFRCPLRGVTAGESYAFMGDEDGEGDGSEGAGDRWGNRWCNG